MQKMMWLWLIGQQGRVILILPSVCVRKLVCGLFVACVQNEGQHDVPCTVCRTYRITTYEDYLLLTSTGRTCEQKCNIFVRALVAT
jgi:hypothetical protein